MKIYILFAACTMVLIFPLTVSASENKPIILNYLPTCHNTVFKVSENNEVYELSELATENELKNINIVELKKRAVDKSLLEIVVNAKYLNAEAIIINNLNTGHVRRNVKVYDLLYDDVNRALIRNVNQIHIRTSVEYITFCNNDKTLSGKRTPVNSQGTQILQNDVVISITSNEKENMLFKANDYEIPSAIITPNSAYGISIQDSSSSLGRLGPASAQLLLSDGSKAFAYGRNLWFFVKNNKIIKITHNVNILNSHGKNMIAYSENYDRNNWVIQEDIKYREELTKVSITFPENEEHGDYYKVNKESNLYLKFETYNSSYQESPEVLLNGFILVSDNNININNNVKFLGLENLDVKGLLNPKEPIKYALKNDLIFNKVLLNDDGEWSIVNNNLLLNIEDNNIAKVRLTESLFGEQSEQQFLNTLKKYNLPTNKADFIKRYPEIEDSFDTLVLNRHNYSIEANFASYDDEAQLIELTVNY